MSERIIIWSLMVTIPLCVALLYDENRGCRGVMLCGPSVGASIGECYCQDRFGK